ncbi:hypothetical protein PRIPAC_82918 [Pristionchus pacificus]|uniref:Glycosyltransferase family 92 protein n=1 Tax=Pristionchus pacificus TaxID=54126 RepID=A0A2A6C2K8_PRIPA|nr:hypothetical protein PRIPAC_82918 [Pristionchus pacificus]|eukprot:PDM72405.1 hypothetical protein PRIPAC_38839 [Pristionchus pacificus]
MTRVAIKHFIIFSLVVLFLLVEYGHFIQKESKQFKVRKKFIPDSNHSSIYIYRAYYDDRSVKGTIRIFLLSKCFVSSDSFVLRYSGKAFPLSIQPLEGSCPWSWAHCEWNAHQLQSPKINGVIPKKVSITLNDHRQIEVEVARRPRVKKDRLQVCVPPLYWYHDWTRMILFFELWKKHSPSFIIYANSYSRNVEKVLKYYEKKGVVQIVNWPILERSDDRADPNLSVYRLSHSLAHNDCVMRMESEYGTLLDIDEYVHIPDNTTLIEFAKSEFTIDRKVGSLLFWHSGLKIMDDSLDGISGAVLVNATGPGKTLFKPDNVMFLSTHWVLSHSRYGLKRKKIPREEALLLHNRVRFRGDQLKDAIEEELTDLDLVDIQRNSKATAREIFGKELPQHNKNVSLVMDKCDASWRSLGCKVPLLHCKKELEESDQWVFLPSSKDSHYTLM